MLTLLGPKARFCDGVSRRAFLRVGALGVGAGALTLADLFRAEARAGVTGTRHKAVINIYLAGGPQVPADPFKAEGYYRQTSASVRAPPPAPRAPTRRKARRETPSQKRAFGPKRVSMAGPFQPREGRAVRGVLKSSTAAASSTSAVEAKPLR